MTKAQKENQARFKKVQAEAKKLKAKNPKLAHAQAVKQAWAILYATGKAKPATKKIGTISSKKRIIDEYAKTGKVNGKKIKSIFELQSIVKLPMVEIQKIMLAKPVKKKIGAVKKKVIAKKQTGKTKIAIDKKIQAKPVGKRISKSSNVYYEARANRSDKGRLLGVKKPVSKSYHKDTKSHNVNIRVMSGINTKAMKQYHDAVKDLEQWHKILSDLDKVKNHYSLSSLDKTLVRNDIKRIKNVIKEQKEHIKELKKHI